MSKVVVILQARMGSLRLPGKVMRDCLGKPLISYSVERLARCKFVDEIVIATSQSPSEKVLVDFAKDNQINIFCGNEHDVLDRYYQCALKFKADIIVRITGDCPLIDPETVDEVIQLYKNGTFDYVSNVDPPSFPDGMDVEVFGFKSLEKAWNLAKAPSEREHVTQYFYNSKEFRRSNFRDDDDNSDLRLTVDEPEDFELIEAIVENFGSSNIVGIGYVEIIAYAKTNKEIFEINSMHARNEGMGPSLKKDFEAKVRNDR